MRKLAALAVLLVTGCATGLTPSQPLTTIAVRYTVETTLNDYAAITATGVTPLNVTGRWQVTVNLPPGVQPTLTVVALSGCAFVATYRLGVGTSWRVCQ